MKKFSFKKLEVWQDAKGLTHLVYKATKDFLVKKSMVW
jgi:hypothetical protein